MQIELMKILSFLKLSYPEFVDLCILCGSDYTATITGIGPIKAYKYVQDHHNIEKIIKVLDKEIVLSKGKKAKYIMPDDYPY